MEIILLERIRNLGDLGDQVTVKPGYGRNYLIPQGKAVRATKENQEAFEKKGSFSDLLPFPILLKLLMPVVKNWIKLK